MDGSWLLAPKPVAPTVSTRATVGLVGPTDQSQRYSPSVAGAVTPSTKFEAVEAKAIRLPSRLIATRSLVLAGLAPSAMAVRPTFVLMADAAPVSASNRTMSMAPLVSGRPTRLLTLA